MVFLGINGVQSPTPLFLVVVHVAARRVVVVASRCVSFFFVPSGIIVVVFHVGCVGAFFALIPGTWTGVSLIFWFSVSILIVPESSSIGVRI